MRTGRYKMSSEHDEVTHRKQLKEKGETLQRLKGKTLKRVAKAMISKKYDMLYAKANNENMRGKIDW